MSTAIKFTKELRDKWAAALRSGKYRKTKSQLHCIVNKRCYYCAIGLLCNVAGMKAKQDPNYPNNTLFYDGTAFSCPKRIQGIPQGVLSKVVTMNDISDRSFKQIADYVATIKVSE